MPPSPPSAARRLARTWVVLLSAAVVALLGAMTTPANASLTAAGAITGTVRDPFGQPVEGLVVSAWHADGASTAGVTDAAGGYEIVGLPAGAYTIHFDGSEHGLTSEYFDDAATWSAAEEISLSGGQTRSGVDATLAAAGVISGTVTGPDGGPVADVYVGVTSSDGTVDGAFTGPDGAYGVAGLRAGTYTVHFDASNPGLVSEYYDDALRLVDADPVTVTGGQTTADVDAALVDGGSISGTVTGPEGPVDGLFVQVTDGALSWSAASALDGTYTVTGLPEGSYVVQFDAGDLGLVTEYYDDVLDADDATPVVVGVGEDRAGIDAVLARGATISGVVTGPDGPVADVWVSAWGLDGIGQGGASTAAAGTYTMTGLAPDDYRVAFLPSGEELRPEYFDDQLSARSATVVTIAGTESVLDVDAVLMSSSVPLFADVPSNHPFVDEVEWLAVSGVSTGYPDGTFHPSASVERQAMAAFLYRFAGEPDFTPPAIPSFVDVPLSHPFFTEIEWLADTAITTGWPDGSFRPMASVERQAMAAFLYRYAGEPSFTDPATASFTDVPKSSPFFTEVEWLASTRITTGWPDHTFRPGNQVERQAMAAFLMRFDQWLWA